MSTPCARRPQGRETRRKWSKQSLSQEYPRGGGHVGANAPEQRTDLGGGRGAQLLQKQPEEQMELALGRRAALTEPHLDERAK